MLNKGSFSFVAMLVINPIVILFYQNCSMAPVSHADYKPAPKAIERKVASEAKPTIASLCNEGKKDCPHPSNE
ncbi:hypothetical protein D3C72_1255370 [compost metagenome]